MPKVNLTDNNKKPNNNNESSQRERRNELKSKYHVFNSYCDAMDRAEDYGLSTYDVYKAANDLDFEFIKNNSIADLEEELKEAALNPVRSKELSLTIAAMEMKKALEKFTDAATKSNKLLVTRAYKESAEMFLDQIKDNLIDSFNPGSQIHKNLTLYKSFDKATADLRAIGEAWRRANTKGGDDPSKPIYECKKPSVEAIADMLLNFYPMVATKGSRLDHSSLYYYDYDAGLFTPNEDLLSTMVVQLNGEVSRSLLDNVRRTLLAKSALLYPYVEAPKYLIKVKNGVFNLITRKFEDDSSLFWTFTTSINCNYIPKKKIPYSVHKGYTFTRLVNDLANNNPKRAKLLKQICKSLMTGVLPSPAIFIVCGQGGDGKSLFFDLMQEIIGVDNTAQINFSMLNQPDKVLSMVGAKFTYGTDNTNGAYINDTGLLKAIATHNRWAFSRKYYEALFAWINTIMVQLCNEMPRMSETGVQMQRRLVAFKAENSHAIKGTADNTLPLLLQSEEYKEYILAEILDEDKIPYYNDFNDVDRSLVNDNLNAEDTIRQYLQFIWSNGAFDNEHAVLPLKLIYTGYVAFCKDNMIDSIVSVRSFHARSQIYFEKLGFRKSKGTRRIKSLLADYGELAHVFGKYAANDDLQDDYIDNSPSSYYYRDLNVEPNPAVLDFEYRRKDKECTSFEFFGVADTISNAVNTNHKAHTAHSLDVATFIRDYGKDKTLNELVNDDTSKSFIDIDLKLKDKHPDYVSYREYYIEPRLKEYEREAQEQLNAYLGYSDSSLSNSINNLIDTTSAKVNNGRVDIDKTLNQIALKNNSNNDSKFFIGMSSKPTANIFNSSNMAELMAATKKAEAEQQEQLIRDTRQAESDVLDDLRALTERYIPETRHSTKSPGYIFVSALKDIINENDYTRLDNIKQYLKEASQARKTLVKAYNENVPPIIALDNNMALLCTGPARVQTFFNTNHKGLLNEMEDQTINEFATKAQEGDKKQSYMRLNDALDFYVELVNKYFKEGGER